MGDDEHARIEDFLRSGPYAVAGASRDRRKYGNKVLRAYQQRGLSAYAVNPHETEIEGARTVPTLADLPGPVRCLSIVTQPWITEGLVEDAAAAGIERLWLQPGAESPGALRRARTLGLSVIAEGPCLLVLLRYRERD